jgi:DNA replication protein DnaC
VSSVTPCESGGFTIDRSGAFACAKPKLAIEDCEKCGGSGFMLTEKVQGGRRYEATAPCPRRRQLERVALFDGVKLPAVHAHSTFEGYRPSTPEQDQALKTAKAFAMGWPAPKGFVLSGPVGTGKTHLLASTLRHLTLERGVRAAYVEISLLFQTIRRGFQEGRSGGEIIEPLAEVELLALDEVGKGRGSPFEMETLDELIARRYNGDRLTLFATNYSLKPPEDRARAQDYLETNDLKEAGKDSRLLCDRVGDRIYSRLFEMCDFVEFTPRTPDMRRARVEQRQGS